MPTQHKKEIVASIADKLDRAAAVYLTDYQGLTHQELESLRRKIKEQDADYTIVKNTLFRIALEKKGAGSKRLKGSAIVPAGPVAVLFAYRDPLKPLRIFAAEFKERLKAALVFDGYYTGDKLRKLAELESTEALRAKLVAGLAAPLFGLARALNWNLQRLAIAASKIQNTKSKSAG